MYQLETIPVQKALDKANVSIASSETIDRYGDIDTSINRLGHGLLMMGAALMRNDLEPLSKEQLKAVEALFQRADLKFEVLVGEGD
jgi:hypothetical protein